MTPKIASINNFKIPPYFRERVVFWAQIYTQFTTEQVLIHDKNNLAIVYDAINHAPSPQSKQSKFQKARKRSRVTSQRVSRIKKSLLELGRTRRPRSKHAQELQRHLIKLKVKRPKGVSRKKYFGDLVQNIRVQTGQRDKIFQGILNASPFEDLFQRLFKTFGLPHELLAISFVESSFNPLAISKVDAKGAWQIMPFIDKKLFPQERGIDARRNIIMSTIGAFHLLAQSFQILKRWDLTVTAYNSGTKHLIRAKRKFRKKKNIDLAYILQNYRSSHLGFASKNFFSEFLALVYILEYKELLFPLDGVKYAAIEKSTKLRYGNISAYISKCGFIPQRLYASVKKSSPHLLQINDHLTFSEKIYPRGTIIFSDTHLISRRYHKLSFRELRKSFPKHYRTLIKKKKCNSI